MVVASHRACVQVVLFVVPILQAFLDICGVVTLFSIYFSCKKYKAVTKAAESGSLWQADGLKCAGGCSECGASDVRTDSRHAARL